MPTKDRILSEIKRTAYENGGKPLESKPFCFATGIRSFDWRGVYWHRWSDAVEEAGFAPVRARAETEQRDLYESLAALVRELGHFPNRLELQRRDEWEGPKVPENISSRVIEDKRGTARKLLAFCEARRGYEDIARICNAVIAPAVERPDVRDRTPMANGFVYLLQRGRYYRLAHTSAMDGRKDELRGQLAEPATVIHEIETDDPVGLTAYWQLRFEERRKDTVSKDTVGKDTVWFDLTAEDVAAFRRRRFM